MSKRYRHVNLDNVPVSRRPFCIICLQLCEHDDEIRSSTKEELERYSNKAPGNNPSPPSLYIIHRKCEE